MPLNLPYSSSQVPNDPLAQYRTTYADQVIGAGPNNVYSPNFNPYTGGYFGSDGVWRPSLSSIGSKYIVGGSNVPTAIGPAMESFGGGTGQAPVQANPYFDFKASSGGPTSMQYYDKSGNPTTQGPQGGTPPLTDLYYGNQYLKGNWSTAGGSPTFSQTLAQNQQGSQQAQTPAQLGAGTMPQPSTGPIPPMSATGPQPVGVRSTTMPWNQNQPKFTPYYQPLNSQGMYGGSPAYNAYKVAGMM